MERYGPVRRCIYCGATSYSPDDGRPLADEHIIPFSLGGDRILLEASCQACERITGNTELIALRGILRGPRHALGLKSRKGHPETLPMYGHHKGGVFRIDIEADKYPSFLFLPAPAWLPPILCCGDLPDEPRMFISGGPLNEYASKIFPWPRRKKKKKKKKNWKRRRRERQLEKQNIVEFSEDPPEKIFHRDGIVTPSLDIKRYFRMLAKIAHGYAVAEVGLDSFQPFLLEIIQGKADDDLGLFFGGPMAQQRTFGTPPGVFHIVSIHFECSFDETVFVVVRMRLFNSLGGPTVYAVVGAMLMDQLAPALQERVRAEGLQRIT